MYAWRDPFHLEVEDFKLLLVERLRNMRGYREFFGYAG